MDTKSEEMEKLVSGICGFDVSDSTPTYSGVKYLEFFPEIDIELKSEKVKNEVAFDYGFHDRIFGEHWQMAMREGELEERVDLYEEVIKRLLGIKRLL